MKRGLIRIVDAAGSAESVGAAHGAAHAAEIQHYANDRVELVTTGLWSGGPMSRSDVLDLAAEMLPEHDAFDPLLHAEMMAMAEAAGISGPEAIVVGGFTDFVDTVRAAVGGEHPEQVIEDDCTAVIVPDHRADGEGFLAQTWDMHDSATEHVILLRVAVDGRPATTVFTTTGCLGQIGMNDRGLCVGINNLTGADGQVGVTWPSVVRKMLTADNADEALGILQSAKLAGAHNFLIFDRAGAGYNVEGMPSIRPVVPLGDEPVVHTNHVIDPEAVLKEGKRANALMESSRSRRERAIDLLEAGPIDADRLFAMLRDPEAICQRAKDPYHIESSGAAVMRPATLDFWACWGIPAENEFQPIAMNVASGAGASGD